jgi:hypothetical protein
MKRKKYRKIWKNKWHWRKELSMPQSTCAESTPGSFHSCPFDHQVPRRRKKLEKDIGWKNRKK